MLTPNEDERLRAIAVAKTEPEGETGPTMMMAILWKPLPRRECDRMVHAHRHSPRLWTMPSPPLVPSTRGHLQGCGDDLHRGLITSNNQLPQHNPRATVKFLCNLKLCVNHLFSILNLIKERLRSNCDFLVSFCYFFASMKGGFLSIS